MSWAKMTKNGGYILYIQNVHSGVSFIVMSQSIRVVQYISRLTT